jgi:hypothetical protein
MSRRLLRWVIAAVAAMLAVFAAFFFVFQLPASATAMPPPQHWLIQKQDLTRIRNAGATATFQWVMCYPNPAGQDLSCPVPTFTDYYAFRRWAPSHPGVTAEIDFEPSVTPRWQMTHLLAYIRRAAQAAGAFNIPAVFSPIPLPGGDMLAADVQAARYGAMAVDVQRHWMVHHPWKYAALLRDWVPRIRAAGPGVVVLAGMSTAPSGNPSSAWQLTETYRLTRSLVDGYWLITPVWPNGSGCAPSGCPLVAVQFLRNIGAG